MLSRKELPVSRRYSDEEKELILQTLDDNYGNVTLTALQTDIPIRTLQDWKRHRKLLALKHGNALPRVLPRKKNEARQQQQQQTTDNDTDEAEEENEYAYIRKRLMEHINNLLETLTDDPDTAHLRINALSRLLDRVIKLEQLVNDDPTCEKVIRIEYKDPDGSIHSTPMWNRNHEKEVPETKADWLRKRDEYIAYRDLLYPEYANSDSSNSP